jgi:hypothetical protein
MGEEGGREATRESNQINGVSAFAVALQSSRRRALKLRRRCDEGTRHSKERSCLRTDCQKV